MKVVLFLVALVSLSFAHKGTSRSAVKRPVLRAFNAARQTVNPPCDYRPRSSPCAGQRKNSLPALQWSNDLEKASRDYAALCPTGHNLNLPQGQAQLFVKSNRPNDARTEAQMLEEYARKWGSVDNAAAYDATTGKTYGVDGRYYKTVINAANRKVGCAVNTVCPNGRAVVCTFETAPTTQPAYPVLVKDTTLSILFRDSIITWVNRARKVAYPVPRSPLSPVSWDDSLAASAQAVADRQTSHPAVYDPALQNVQTVYSLDYIQANPAFSFAAFSFSRGIFYDFKKNTCHDARGRTRQRCGLYTQLVGKDVTKIGCGLAWKNGATFVVCQFDKSYSNGGSNTVVPY